MPKDKSFIDIGKRLHVIRGEADQRGFSRLVEVSQQAISNYERGNLPGSWALLRRLNAELNINLNWLFSGQGFKDYREGIPYAALADNRPPDWPQVFLGQVAFTDTHPLERVLGLYFLYLFTEPADAKARLMADFQAIVDPVRVELEAPGSGADEKLLGAVLEALATDDRARAVESLIALGDHLEREGRATHASRRSYLAALNLARMQGLTDREIEAAGLAGRTYGRDGRWREAENLLDAVLSRLGEPEDRSSSSAHRPSGVQPAVAARALAGYAEGAVRMGELSTARERLARALRWATPAGDERLQARIRGDLALVDALARRTSGDENGALKGLEALSSQAETDRDETLFSAASLHLAELLIERGDHEEAARLLDRSASAAEDDGDPWTLARRRILTSRVAAARGQTSAARTALLAALRYARERGLEREFELAASALETALSAPELPASRSR